MQTCSKPWHRRTLLAAFILLASAAAADDVLVTEVWFDRSPILPASIGGEAGADESAEAMLEEARFVFSGMIYGFDFVYTPSDRARQIEEVFSLEPVARIPWGDESLQVAGTRGDGYRTYARFYFYPDRNEQARLRAWSSSAIPRSSAESRASIVGGRPAKYEAIEEAVKEAVRAYMRTRIYNKPREIRGAITLVEPPKVRLSEGAFIARVRIAMRIDDVREYRHF